MTPQSKVAQSSHLMNYEYDPNTETLTITFVNGSVYQYSGVPLTVFHNMAQSGGAGTYFWANVRDKYPATKLTR